MVGWLYPFLTIFYFGLLLAGLARMRQRRTIGGAMLTAFLVALAVDALVIAIGLSVGEGAWLLRLNWLRLGLRALAFPLAVAAAFDVVRRTGLDWAARRESGPVLAAIGLGLAALGLFSIASSAGLVAERFAGTLRYKPVGIAGPTLAAILAMTLLITFGMILFRRAGTPWMTLASTLLFFGSVFPPSLVGPITASIAEALFALALLVTELQTVSRGTQ
ncbi:MAG: hypothetical protein SF339_22110 [Blastocatellia bacterium]|nr:hypothetical protein [Blastocatellia bacterium]